MMSDHVADIKERIKKTGMGLRDALSVLDMADMALPEEPRREETSSPYEVFGDLNKLIDRTAGGARIERFKPRKDKQPFHTFEIHTEEGDILGYLNLMYLRKRIPCYYLVYVEVVASFRRLGLGHKVLGNFMRFLKEKGAVGLLDNIIPPNDPTYEVYTKLGWKDIKDHIGTDVTHGWGNYMVFVPKTVQAPDLRRELVRILFSLRKKRPVIDMHDNEDMVKRTITEFRSVYEALTQLFEAELSSNTQNSLMSFMFTRLTTKFIGFRRRIATLIGYTGGESLEQISFSDRVRALQIQPYSLWKPREEGVRMWGEEQVPEHWPSELRGAPTFFVESLPLYERPYLRAWMDKKGITQCKLFRIADLLDLGFDPTRLRAFHHQDVDYVFERVSPRFLPSLLQRGTSLKKIDARVSGVRFRGATIQTNPPVLILCDRGNVYILRKKVGGIHFHEALDQLRTSPNLKEMNRAVGIDRALLGLTHEVNEWIGSKFGSRFREEVGEITYFLPWNIEKNIPRIYVDMSGVFLQTLWIA